MKTKYILLTIAGMMGLGFTSCEDELDIAQHGVLNYDTFYQTDEEAENASTAIYLQINSSKYNLHMCINALGDDFWSGGAARNDNADLEQFNEFTFNTEAGYVQSLFETYYSIIYKCNVIFGHVPEETPIQKRTHAEARTLRAWAYFYLINLWGNPPLVDHELTADEYSQPNGSTEDLWNLVITDLQTAIDGGALPEKTDVNDNQTWRVTKQFAQAILGKAYLWTGKYKEAAAQFDAVVNSGKYALYQGTYSEILDYNHKHNCESMFESNRVYDPNNVWGNFDQTGVMCHWRIDKMTVPASLGLEMNQGWGFLVPQKSLYDDFVKVEGADGYRLNETMKTYNQIAAMGCSVKQAIISEGYFMWKWRYLDEQSPEGAFAMVDDNNPRWMRYAEVLLCGAEAHYLAGNQSKADEYMNMIRSRAQAPTKSGYTEEEIRREKRLELCGEYTRYLDMLRWGIAADLLAKQGEKLPFLNPNGEVEYKTYNTNPSLYGFKKGKHELFPYPGTEVKLNRNIKQNPGW